MFYCNAVKHGEMTGIDLESGCSTVMQSKHGEMTRLFDVVDKYSRECWFVILFSVVDWKDTITPYVHVKVTGNAGLFWDRLGEWVFDCNAVKTGRDPPQLQSIPS